MTNHPFPGASWTCRDGVYVGSAADSHGDAAHLPGRRQGPRHPRGPRGRLPSSTSTSSHVAVGDGYDPALDRWRNYVYDIDSGELTWLPGIGGDYAGARRINDHGVGRRLDVARPAHARPSRLRRGRRPDALARPGRPSPGPPR